MPSSAPVAAKEVKRAEGRNAVRSGCGGSGRAGGRAGERASEAAGEERGGERRSPGAPESRGPGVQSAGLAGEPAAWGSVPLGPSPSGGRGGPALRREAAARRRGPGAGPASRACRDGCGEDIAGGWHGGPRGVRRAGVAALAFPRRPQCGMLPSERRGRPAGQGRPRPRAELRIRRSWSRSRSGRAQGTPGPGGSDPRGRVAQRPPPGTLSGKAERILPAGGASPRGEFDEGRPGPAA